MRTTLILDDALLQRAREAAARSGRTLSDVVNQALAESFLARKEPPPRFEMVVYGKGSTHHEPHHFTEVLEEDDAASVGH